MIVLYGVRGSSPAFDTGLRPLPRKVVNRFPATNFLVVYGAEAQVAPQALVYMTPNERSDEPLVQAKHLVLGLEDLAFENVVARIATHARSQWPNERPPDESIYPHIAEQAREIAPGVLWMCHRSRHLSAPMLWLGLSRDGIEHSEWRGKGHLCFIAFGPEAQAEAWENALVAKVLLVAASPDALERIRTTSDVAGVVEALRDAPNRSAA